MSSTITARRLFTDIGEIEFPVVELAADGTIAGISSDPSVRSDDTLTASFFDLHTHGAVGEDVMSATPAGLSKLQSFYAQHGVAHYLPTTVTAPVDDTLRALERLADAVEGVAREGEAQAVGIHLEGPFLSHAKRGVHPANELQKPSIELFDRFQQAARNNIVLMTIAPEEPGALELIRHATAQGVRCSLGHSNATSAETLAGIGAGATTSTHIFNAMRALDHREPGIAGTVLDDDALYADAIADLVHVAAPLLRLWFKAKPADRRILITDSMSATGCPDGAYKLGAFDVTVRGGRALLTVDLAGGKETLAGSLLTMDRAVENLIATTRCSLGDAATAATHNPAAMLGQSVRTLLAPGSAANLNRFDAKNRLTATYLRGRVVRS